MRILKSPRQRRELCTISVPRCERAGRERASGPRACGTRACAMRASGALSSELGRWSSRDRSVNITRVRVDKAAGLPYRRGPFHGIRSLSSARTAVGGRAALRARTLINSMPNYLLEATPEQVQVWLRFAARGFPPGGFRPPRVPPLAVPALARISGWPHSRSAGPGPEVIAGLAARPRFRLLLAGPAASRGPPASRPVGSLARASIRETVKLSLISLKPAWPGCCRRLTWPARWTVEPAIAGTMCHYAG
jgi:hypothetical protein